MKDIHQRTSATVLLAMAALAMIVVLAGAPKAIIIPNDARLIETTRIVPADVLGGYDDWSPLIGDHSN